MQPYGAHNRQMGYGMHQQAVGGAHGWAGMPHGQRPAQSPLAGGTHAQRSAMQNMGGYGGASSSMMRGAAARNGPPRREMDSLLEELKAKQRMSEQQKATEKATFPVPADGSLASRNLDYRVGGSQASHIGAQGMHQMRPAQVPHSGGATGPAPGTAYGAFGSFSAGGSSGRRSSPRRSGGGSFGGSDDSGSSGVALFLKELPTSITEDTVCQLFGRYGVITGVDIGSNDKKPELKQGYVTMANRDSAERAKDALHDREVDGVPLWVEWAPNGVPNRSEEWPTALHYGLRCAGGNPVCADVGSVGCWQQLCVMSKAAGEIVQIRSAEEGPTGLHVHMPSEFDLLTVGESHAHRRQLQEGDNRTTAVQELLQTGGICWRFCEDGSLPDISRRSECPDGTHCNTTMPENSFSFDTCSFPWTCQEASTSSSSSSALGAANRTGNTTGAAKAAAKALIVMDAGDDAVGHATVGVAGAGTAVASNATPVSVGTLQEFRSPQDVSTATLDYASAQALSFAYHKEAFPLDWESDGRTVVLAVVGLIIAASSGIGGGGILVPLYMLMLGFHPKHAIALSNFTIFGGSIANTVLNCRKRHPQLDRGLIDWDLILIMEPLTIFGAVFGSLLSKVLPSLLLTTALVAILGFMGHRTLKKGIGMWQEESRGACLIDKGPACLEMTSSNGNRLTSSAGDALSMPSVENGVGSEEERPYLELESDCDAAAASSRSAATSSRQIGVTFKIATLTLCFVGTCALTVLRGGGNLHSPLGFSCGSLGFWLLYFSAVPWVFGFAIYFRHLLVSEFEQKVRHGYAFGAGEVQWNSHNTVKYPIYCAVSGLLAGLFGVGGGIVKGPLMLEMGIMPSVASASAAAMILFTSAAASTSFVVFGLLHPQYGAMFFLLGVVCTAFGQCSVGHWVKRYKRQSFIVLSIGSVICLSSILITANMLYNATHNPFYEFLHEGLTAKGVCSAEV